MTLFLSQVRRSPGGLHRHGAGRRQFTKPKIFRPDNIRFSPAPPMPLNSTPRSIYGMSFEKANSELVFDDLAAVIRPLQQGLPRLS